jgi:hypothetical protein
VQHQALTADEAVVVHARLRLVTAAPAVSVRAVIGGVPFQFSHLFLSVGANNQSIFYLVQRLRSQ